MVRRRILFCNIAWMKNYKGYTEDDQPINGGKYVSDTHNAHEAYNFDPIYLDNNDEKYCLGFVETKTTNEKERNQLHIEKIYGVHDSNIDKLDDVLVIWCAKSDSLDFTSMLDGIKMQLYIDIMMKLNLIMDLYKIITL